MQKKREKQEGKGHLTFFEQLLELFGWIQIVASPLLLGIIIGFVVFLGNPFGFGLIIGTAVAFLGLGIVWATRIWQKKGTMNFMSRIMASPELDNDADENQQHTTWAHAQLGE